MKSIEKFCCVFLIACFSLSLAGCDSGETMQQAAPEMGELEKFLQENPEIAAEGDSIGNQDVDVTASDEY